MSLSSFGGWAGGVVNDRGVIEVYREVDLFYKSECELRAKVVRS
jgi:hypothetical protein